MKNKTHAPFSGYCLGLWMAVALSTSSVAVPNLVQNGSFESGDVGWGWTYNFGIAYGFPGAAAGGNFAEVYGTIYQTLATTPGQTYDVRFALAGNFNIASLTTADIVWGNQDLGTVSWNPSGHNVNNFGWIWADFHVTAISSSTLFTIANPYVGDGSGRIARVDAVSVTAVPDASSTAVLLGFGVLGILGTRPFLKLSKIKRNG